jgi:hypothetical protein
MPWSTLVETMGREPTTPCLQTVRSGALGAVYLDGRPSVMATTGLTRTIRVARLWPRHRAPDDGKRVAPSASPKLFEHRLKVAVPVALPVIALSISEPDLCVESVDGPGVLGEQRAVERACATAARWHDCEELAAGDALQGLGDLDLAAERATRWRWTRTQS